jgi:hypothetical protein
MKKIKPWNLLALVAALTLLLPAFVWAAYPAEVARTGQTTCYDDNGPIIDCAGTGQDGEIQAGVAWPSPRFTDRGDGTVSDNLTGLLWLKNANLMVSRNPTFDADGTINDGKVTWQHALDYVTKLNNESYLTHTDWRLPNKIELRSLADYSRSNMALPDTNPFTNVNSSFYWSSTSSSVGAFRAWSVYFYYGAVSTEAKSDYGYVWPVRSGQCGLPDNSFICLPKTGQTKCYNETGDNITCTATGQDGQIQEGVACPNPRFTDYGDGAVTDNLTGLMWSKNANLMVTRDPAFDADDVVNDGWVTWQHAFDYVTKLNSELYLDHNDWRLPNVNELESLIDAGMNNPALPSGHPFQSVQPRFFDNYWSSTTHSPGNAWIVDFYTGGANNGGKANGGFVWPVRAGQVGNPLISTTTTTVLSTTTSIISSTTTTSGGGSTTTSVSSGGTTTTSIGGSTTTTTTTGSGPCPAKNVLGTNNPKLENLRDFRDSKLANSAVGRRIIGIYYKNADSINAALERSPALRAATRRVLEVIAPMVGR